MREAIGVFAEYGYKGASLRVLAAACGMEKGHLSYYFATKHDLLNEIVDDLHDSFLAGIAAWSSYPAVDHEARLREVFRSHVELVCKAHQQTRVAYESLRFLTPDHRAEVTAKRDSYERALGQMIDRCRAVGAIDDVPTSLLTKIVLGILNWPYQWYVPTGRKSASEIADILADRAVASLRPAPASVAIR